MIPSQKYNGWFHTGSFSIGYITVRANDNSAMMQFDIMQELLYHDGTNRLTVIP